MPEQIKEGTIIRGPQGERRVMRGGQWVAMPPAETGLTPLGGGYVKNEAGGVFKEGPKGGLSQVGGAPQMGADAATRVGISLAPMIEAQRQLDRSERRANAGDGLVWNGFAGRGNPYENDRGAVWLDSLDESKPAKWLGLDTGAMARAWGGQDYQDYQQAASTYESAMLPIFSGAAVSPSEAQRLVRADLPQLGDTPETLSKKSRNRANRINYNAQQMGQKAPFVVPAKGPPRPVTGFGAGDGSALRDPRARPAAPAASAPKKPAAASFRILSVE